MCDTPGSPRRTAQTAGPDEPTPDPEANENTAESSRSEGSIEITHEVPAPTNARRSRRTAAQAAKKAMKATFKQDPGSDEEAIDLTGSHEAAEQPVVSNPLTLLAEVANDMSQGESRKV